ncbi:toll/interleukin-1 receptor domain-containing protein [bacterium RCC_150]
MNQGEQNQRQRHAFISYVREDQAKVDRLQEALEAVGVSVWRDTKDLWPGQNWEDKIRAAIQSDSLAFIACFSDHTLAREKSYQNAELALAAEEYRLRPPTTEWLVPVRFSECPVPEWNLGAGRNLNSLHRTDLFGDTETIQMVRLVQAVQRIVAPAPRTAPVITPAIAEGVAELRKAESPRQVQAQEIKALLRDPNGDILLEDLAMDILNPIRATLTNKDEFPTTIPGESSDALAVAKYFIQQIQAYEKALEPAFELILLGAMYGLPRHEPIWTRLVQMLAATAQISEGNTRLLQLRGYPVVLSSYIASIAALSRSNYGALRAFVADPEIRVLRGKIPTSLYTGSRLVASEIDWIASALSISESQGTDVDENLVDGLRRKTIGNRHTPISDHLFKALTPLFDRHFGDEAEYAEAFDKAEVFMDLIATDAAAEHKDRYWGGRGGYGRYTWRHVHSDTPPEVAVSKAFEATLDGWTPLLGGLFGGSANRAKTALAEVVSGAQTVRGNQW